jgi:hypothetical protein
LLIYDTPGTAESRFNERLLETLLGVAVAVTFGVAIPARRRRAASTPPPNAAAPGYIARPRLISADATVGRPPAIEHCSVY